MKILITGANGFLGYYLVKNLLDKNYDVIATGKGDCRLPYKDLPNFQYVSMDFTDPFSVHDVFEEYQPAVVVHAGAMSKPDDCELHQWDAFKTNVEGTLNMVINAEEQRSFFLFISTDFVFSGKEGNYDEKSLPAPVNFYGRTKAEAEEAVKEYNYDWSIVRTNLVYGKPFSGRNNLLTIVQEKLENITEYNVFDDQVRTPTYVEDLSSAIVTIIKNKAKGVIHISGAEMFTPYQMAIQTADYLGLDKSLIKKVTEANFQQPAKRPHTTNFIIEKARRELKFNPISFQEGLKKTFG